MPTTLKLREEISYKKRRQISIITFSCILLCLMAFLVMPAITRVHADNVGDGVGDFFGEIANPIADFINDLTNGEFIKSSIDVFYSTNIMETIINDISGETQTFMTGFTAALKVVGVLICLLNAIVMTVKELERAEMTMESVLRILLAFVIPCVLIMEYDFIIKAFSKIGLWLYQTLSGSIDDMATDSGQPFCRGIDKPEYHFGSIVFGSYLSDLFNWLIALIKGVILMIPLLIINYVIIIQILTGVLSCYVEIVLRHLFIPVAIANISHEGARSSGVRYIKKYFGCFMKVGAIMVAVSAVFYVWKQVIAIPGLGLVEKLIFVILLIPLSKQALKMTNEIIDDALGD